MEIFIFLMRGLGMFFSFFLLRLFIYYVIRAGFCEFWRYSFVRGLFFWNNFVDGIG